MAMRRTQIYLTDEEVRALSREAKRTGKSMSSLIREAIDRVFGSDEERSHRLFLRALEASRGAWKDVTDEEIEDMERLRHGWSDRQKEFLDRLDHDVP